MCERERILVVNNGIARMQPRMEEALAALAANGDVTSKAVESQQLEGSRSDDGLSHGTVENSLEVYGPSAILLSGQDVNAYAAILRWAKHRQVPVIYFLDANMASIASEARMLGTEMQEVAALSEMLHGADLIYAPNEELKARLELAFPELRTIARPAGQQDSGQRQPLSALSSELLHTIALGHAAVRLRNSQA